MAQQRIEMQATCPTCRRKTLHHKLVYTVPHIAHALITLFLLGLWAPVWFLHWWETERRNQFEPWRCDFCGLGRNSLRQNPFVIAEAVEPPLDPDGWKNQVVQAMPPNRYPAFKAKK